MKQQKARGSAPRTPLGPWPPDPDSICPEGSIGIESTRTISGIGLPPRSANAGGGTPSGVQGAEPPGRRSQWFFLCLLLAFANCRSPEPRIFTLEPVAGTIVRTPPRVVEVRRPGLAGYLDRSAIVVKNTAYQLDVNSGTRWAEPLGDMIGRVLAQDLSQRLAGSSVFAESGGISTRADLRVELDVQRFDRAGDGVVRLQGELAIEDASGRLRVSARPIALEAPAPGGDAASLAAAMSGLLGQVADQVAQEIGEMRQGFEFLKGQGSALDPLGP